MPPVRCLRPFAGLGFAQFSCCDLTSRLLYKHIYLPFDTEIQMKLVKLLKTLTRNHASPPKYRSVTHVFLKYLWDIEKKNTTHVIISLPIAKTNIISQVQNPRTFFHTSDNPLHTHVSTKPTPHFYLLYQFVYLWFTTALQALPAVTFASHVFFSIHINWFTIHQWTEIPCNGTAQWPAQNPRNDHKHSVQFDEDRRIRQIYIWIIGGILC